MKKLAIVICFFQFALSFGVYGSEDEDDTISAVTKGLWLGAGAYVGLKAYQRYKADQYRQTVENYERDARLAALERQLIATQRRDALQSSYIQDAELAIIKLHENNQQLRDEAIAKKEFLKKMFENEKRYDQWKIQIKKMIPDVQESSANVVCAAICGGYDKNNNLIGGPVVFGAVDLTEASKKLDSMCPDKIVFKEIDSNNGYELVPENPIRICYFNKFEMSNLVGDVNALPAGVKPDVALEAFEISEDSVPVTSYFRNDAIDALQEMVGHLNSLNTNTLKKEYEKNKDDPLTKQIQLIRAAPGLMVLGNRKADFKERIQLEMRLVDPGSQVFRLENVLPHRVTHPCGCEEVHSTRTTLLMSFQKLRCEELETGTKTMQKLICELAAGTTNQTEEAAFCSNPTHANAKLSAAESAPSR